MPESSLNAVKDDAIVSRNFYLEFDNVKVPLSNVSGLDMELDVVELNQNLPNGKQVHLKMVGGGLKAPDITLTRMAPVQAVDDPIWKWFKEIRDKGMKADARDGSRKNGSVIIYDTSLTELGRFNFANAWPSKISTSDLSTDSNEALTETITLSCEFIDRVK
jgi:phage tail-like protein